MSFIHQPPTEYLLTESILVCIIKNNITLSDNDKRALSIIINSNYSGCCGCEIYDEEYYQMKELTRIIESEKYYGYSNCGNGNCIHIRNLSDLIKEIIPQYPFDFFDMDDVNSKRDSNDSLITQMYEYSHSIDEELMRKYLFYNDDCCDGNNCRNLDELLDECVNDFYTKLEKYLPNM